MFVFLSLCSSSIILTKAMAVSGIVSCCEALVGYQNGEEHEEKFADVVIRRSTTAAATGTAFVAAKVGVLVFVISF